jgi:hypothetical protein
VSQTPRAAGRAGPDGGPARGRHSAAPRQRRLWPLLLSLVLVAGAVAGGLALHRSSADSDQSISSPKTSGPPEIDETARTAGVNKVLVRRAQAVQGDDEQEFLRDVDPGDKLLVARQKLLFENLRQFGFASLRYEQLREQFDQRLVDKYGPSTYLVGVAMTYQF